MEKELIYTNGLVNYQDQKLDLLLGNINIWELIILLMNNWNTISAYHDICYDMGKNKGECDKEMVISLDKIPYGEMPKWGSTARFLINTKQKLGLGLNSKNVKRR